MKKKILIGLGLLLCGLICAELGSRAADDPSNPDFVFDALHADTQFTSWWQRRSGGLQGENGWISINAQGWRGTAPFQTVRSADVGRIAVVGTGSAFGENLSDEQTWPERLEQALGRRTGQPVEVYNFGWPGATVVYLDRVVLDQVMATQPDVVVLGFGGFNEALRADKPESETLHPEATIRNALRGLSLFRRAERGLWGWSGGDSPRQPKVSVSEFSTLLNNAVTRIRDAQVKVVLVQEVVIHPDIEDLWSKDEMLPYRAVVQQVAAKHGVAIFDPALVLPESDLKELFWKELLYGPEAAGRVGEGVAQIISGW